MGDIQDIGQQVGKGEPWGTAGRTYLEGTRPYADRLYDEMINRGYSPEAARAAATSIVGAEILLP
jgi:hypothetical protein